jgi:hypothetical protein
MIRINRDFASGLGVNPSVIESTLYDAFGQRYVTQIYAPLNTYRVVMEVAPPGGRYGQRFFTKMLPNNAPLSQNPSNIQRRSHSA